MKDGLMAAPWHAFASSGSVNDTAVPPTNVSGLRQLLHRYFDLPNHNEGNDDDDTPGHGTAAATLVDEIVAAYYDDGKSATMESSVGGVNGNHAARTDNASLAYVQMNADIRVACPTRTMADNDVVDSTFMRML